MFWSLKQPRSGGRAPAPAALGSGGRLLGGVAVAADAPEPTRRSPLPVATAACVGTSGPLHDGARQEDGLLQLPASAAVSWAACAASAVLRRPRVVCGDLGESLASQSRSHSATNADALSIEELGTARSPLPPPPASTLADSAARSSLATAKTSALARRCTATTAARSASLLPPPFTCSSASCLRSAKFSARACNEAPPPRAGEATSAADPPAGRCRRATSSAA